MGRINPLIDELSTPRIPLVLSWAAAYDGAYGPKLDFSQAVPGYPPPPEMLAALGEVNASREFVSYGDIEGVMAMREKLAAHQSALYGANLSAANIHMTAGCNQAFVCMAMVAAKAGETILVTNPYYFNHESSLAMLGIGVKTVATDPDNGFLPTPDAVAAAITPDVKAFAVVSPNNPTGAIYPAELLEALHKVCKAKNVWLIVDETYRDFMPVEIARPHALFSIPGWQDHVVSLYSFSKSFCIPGHRLGAITASPAVVEAVAKIYDNLALNAPRPVQGAVARMFDATADWRAANRAEIALRADALRATMAKVNSWELAAVGAYFAFLKHPYEDRSSEEVAEVLCRKMGVACLPGSFFGAGNERYLRFAFANASSETIGLLGDRLMQLAW